LIDWSDAFGDPHLSFTPSGGTTLRKQRPNILDCDWLTSTENSP
jgi:hypothetical protein